MGWHLTDPHHLTTQSSETPAQAGEWLYAVTTPHPGWKLDRAITVSDPHGAKGPQGGDFSAFYSSLKVSQASNKAALERERAGGADRAAKGGRGGGASSRGKAVAHTTNRSGAFATFYESLANSQASGTAEGSVGSGGEEK